MSLMVHTLIKLLFSKKEREKILYPCHPVKCLITGASENGKAVFLTKITLNNLTNMIQQTFTH